MLFNRFIRILKSNLLQNQSPPQASSAEQSYTNAQSGNRQQQQTASFQENKQENTYYRALEVTPGTSFDDIKASYKKLVKKYHPDLFHNNPEKRRYAEVVTQQINEAYAYFEQKMGMH
ncbi:J domain-containing protein [Rhodocytophaga aerolata]|uniref:J domain-containing protein n=1 Tax=Rhodocytophaga aerolata TaxID=455078 RepID=A0ABT8QZA4_9BACT|nr:J domain-containing protein [Rhodocytophaga aerolata]MDO1445172.1 J domain-containing protein [Rhodocytophaga aerolata]